MTGNYASYVSHNRAQGKTGSETQAWYYDIDKVSGYGCCAAPWHEPDPTARHRDPCDPCRCPAVPEFPARPCDMRAIPGLCSRARSHRAWWSMAQRWGDAAVLDSCAMLAQVGYSAIVFYGYVGVIGLALWAMMKWWFKSEVGLAQVWCIYGARHEGTQSALASANPAHHISSGIGSCRRVLKKSKLETSLQAIQSRAQ